MNTNTESGIEVRSAEVRSLLASYGRVAPVSGAALSSISLELLSRRIYGYLWLTAAAAEYWLQGEIQLWRDNSVTQRLPFSTGLSIAGGVMNQSKLAMLATTTVAIPDCMNLTVCQPIAGEPTNVVLAPIRIAGQFDAVSYHAIEAVGVTNARIFLACLSYA